MTLDPTIRLFIAVGEASLARKLSDCFEALGCTVCGDAGRAEGLLESLEEASPHLVIMDLHLAGEAEAFKTAAHLHQHSDAEVVLLSEAPNGDLMQRAKDAGVIHWIVEPIRTHDLQSIIQVVEYKRAMECRLRDSEDRLDAQVRVFETLANSALVGIYRVDVDGRCEYINKRACELTGVEEHEALGLGWTKSLHPADLERFMAERAKVLEGAPPLRIELRFIHPSGAIRWVLLQSSRILDLEGQSAGYVGTLTDITEQKLVESSMKAISTELISLRGADLFEVAIKRMCDLLQLELGAGARVIGDDSPELSYFAILKDGEFLEGRLEGNCHRPCFSLLQGTPLRIESKAYEQCPENLLIQEMQAEAYYGEPLLDHSGQVLGTLCVAGREPFADSDLVVRIVHLFSEALGAYLERERAESRFEALFEFSPSGLVLADAEGCVVLLNQEAERIFGWNLAEVRGNPVGILVPRSKRAEYPWLKSMQGVQEGGSLSPSRQVGLRKDGREFPMEICLTSIASEEGPMMAAAVRDLTQQEAMEQRVAYGEKMEAVGELAGGIAHDFNNLLTAINGFAYLLAKTVNKSSREGRMIHEITRAGERAASLTRELLTFSRRHKDRPRVISLNAVVTAAETMLRFLLGDKVTLQLDLEEPAGNFLADPAQLEQVVVNLVINARDAMTSGGRLQIRSRLVNLTVIEADALSGLNAGPHVVLELVDSGVGISEEVLSHIFEPFFTTKSRAKGTGLGLAVVYGIVQGCGGAIDVKTELGKGTEFRVYFPQVSDELEPLSEELEVEHQQPQVMGTILVVEDESTVLQLTQVVLEDAGYKVLTAENGEDAMGIIEAQEGSLDVLLTDIVLPGISGHQVAESMRSMHAETKVVFMSGYAADRSGTTDAVLESVHVLQKPFSPGQLLDTMGDLFA